MFVVAGAKSNRRVQISTGKDSPCFTTTSKMMSKTWSVEEHDACYIVKDRSWPTRVALRITATREVAQCVASASVNSNAALSDIRTTIEPIDVRVAICNDLGILEVSATSPASIPSISRMTGVSNTARLRCWGGSSISQKSYSAEPFY